MGRQPAARDPGIHLSMNTKENVARIGMSYQLTTQPKPSMVSVEGKAGTGDILGEEVLHIPPPRPASPLPPPRPGHAYTMRTRVEGIGRLCTVK